MEFIMRILKRVLLFVLLVFILPAAVSLAVWQTEVNRPVNWHSANWNTAGILPPAEKVEEAVVYIMAARTGRWKGAFSVHSWIVTKQKDEGQYKRYDKVGWGSPIRLNAYPADANWYSNPPAIVKAYKGKEAERLIPRIEAAVENYPHAMRGNYEIWPGPNSNTFISHVLNEVPEMDMVLPANAIGRDFLSGGRRVNVDPDLQNFQFTLDGYLGFAVGRRSGVELQFLGLVAGFDLSRPGLKLPGFGTMHF